MKSDVFLANFVVDLLLQNDPFYSNIQIWCMKGARPIDKIDLCTEPIVCTTQSNHKGN